MFIPRHSVVENQFCSYAEGAAWGAGGIGGVVAYAGSVVYLDPAATNEEPMVKIMADGITETPFGFMMQKVKVGYHNVHPTGFVMPGDLGSSDAIAQPVYNNAGVIAGHKSVPVGIAHLGIFDTVHYICTAAAGTASLKMTPGQTLYPAAYQARVTNNPSLAADADGETGTAAGDTTAIAVGRVMKGASLAKCQANMDNVTLYPVRIKLLI